MIITSTSITKKLFLLFLIIAGFYYARDFLIPLAIAIVLATLFLPLCKRLEAKKIYRGISAFICLLILLGILLGIGLLFGWKLSELTGELPLIRRKVVEAVDAVQGYIYTHVGIPIVKQSQILKSEQPLIGSVIQVAVGSLTRLIAIFILVLVYVFLLLYYRSHIRIFLLKSSPPFQQKEIAQIIESAAHVSQQYLMGLIKMIVCLWIMYGIGFSIIGVKNALFFAFLCGLLEIVPFVGNIAGTLITVLVALVQGASFITLGGIIGVYGLVQFIQGWVLEPIIVGPQVKINPFTTIVALVAGELIWGIPGIFLAIPLVAMLKIVCDHIESLKSLGFLISEIDTTQAEKRIY